MVTVTGLWNRIRPTGLRGRLRWTLVLFVSFASIVLAVGAILLDETLERTVIQDALVAESQRLDAQGDIPAGGAFETSVLRDYFVPSASERRGADAPLPLPSGLRALEPGFHEDVDLAGNGRDYDVRVVDRPHGRLYVAYDTTGLVARERWFAGGLVAVVVVMLLIARLVGGRVASRLTGPLEDLAATVHDMDPGERQVRVSEQRRDAELRQIATAFNGYLARMDEFVERERAFSQTVSHELRTPLATIRLAIESLRTRFETTGGSQPLDRIERAMRQMREIVDSMLALARPDGVDATRDEACPVRQIVEEVIESHRYLLDGRAVCLEAGEIEAGAIQAPRRLLLIAVSNLVRNAIQNTRDGTVTVSYRDGVLMVDDTGTGIADENARALDGPGVAGAGRSGSGYGLGLHIIGRISELCGWDVRLESRSEGGTRSTIVFPRVARTAT